MNSIIAEFIGTALLVTFGNGVVANVVLQRSKGYNSGWIVIAAGWAFAVTIAVYCVTSFSGAHLNPAVTIALASIGTFPWAKVPGYIVAQIAGSGFVHVSLDMDALEPDIAPGVGTPVRGGLSYREAHLAMELVAESGLAGSLEVVEVNPILDNENETAKLAVELVASALGARIL